MQSPSGGSAHRLEQQGAVRSLGMGARREHGGPAPGSVARRRMKGSPRSVERPGLVIRLVGAASLVAVIAGASLGTAGPAASNTTALQVAAVGAPQRVHGSDGRE